MIMDLWNIGLLHTYASKFLRYGYPFFFFLIFKASLKCLPDMSSRHLQDMSSRHLQDMSLKRLEDVFSVTFFCLPRRRQDVLRDVFKTSSRSLKGVFKTSSRRLGKWNLLTLKSWRRRLQYISWRRLQDQQRFAG